MFGIKNSMEAAVVNWYAFVSDSLGRQDMCHVEVLK